MNRLDAHIHLFERGFDTGTGVIDAGVAEYEAMRTAAGIDAALVVGYESGERYAGNNDFIAGLAIEHSWVKPVAYLPGNRTPTPELLAGLRDQGHLGFALYLEEPGATEQNWPVRLIGDEAFLGALVSINARGPSLAAAYERIAALESATVLVSHLGMPGRTVTLEETRARLAPLRALSVLPHVLVKLSGLYAIDPEPPYGGARVAAELALDWFGADRIVWGSDFSPALGFGSPAEIMAFPGWFGARLNARESTRVAGRTLRAAIDRADGRPVSGGS